MQLVVVVVAVAAAAVVAPAVVVVYRVKCCRPLSLLSLYLFSLSGYRFY